MVAGCDFPQEITDSIIDCLAHDRGALKSCALTRRAWLHRSRHHLHRKVALDGNIYRRPDYYSTPAAQHIRDLKLVSPPQPPRSGSVDQSGTWTIISRFTEINTLTILYSSWSGESYKYLAPITNNVTHLELLVASFGNCDEFFAFVAMFPNLQSLALSSLTIGSPFGRQSIRIDPPSRLTSLRYGVHFQHPAIAQRIADWLSYLPRTTLPHFSLTWKAPSHSDLTHILKALGPRLAHLEVPVSPSSDDVLTGNFTPRLQSINLVVNGDFTTDHISAASSILSDITSVDVHKVGFLCNGTSLIDLDVQALQPIDELFSHPQFEDLQNLSFVFSGKSCTAEVDKPDVLADSLARNMRRAKSRGILSINFN
ncbi:hypothetical protein BDY19DRAFT_932660 [Irpex rosettiformis]|uniref:Uncharacterized protein n=1 Tax=Irpex rosettiformis TaxID=378272 RepID=A0ACB8U9R4_9APHY|nr:hypothetical protein BDY19DRAFT_932660 [Irpex rosettiformis]